LYDTNGCYGRGTVAPPGNFGAPGFPRDFFCLKRLTVSGRGRLVFPWGWGGAFTGRGWGHFRLWIMASAGEFGFGRGHAMLALGGSHFPGSGQLYQGKKKKKGRGCNYLVTGGAAPPWRDWLGRYLRLCWVLAAMPPAIEKGFRGRLGGLPSGFLLLVFCFAGYGSVVSVLAPAFKKPEGECCGPWGCRGAGRAAGPGDGGQWGPSGTGALRGRGQAFSSRDVANEVSGRLGLCGPACWFEACIYLGPFTRPARGDTGGCGSKNTTKRFSPRGPGLSRAIEATRGKEFSPLSKREDTRNAGVFLGQCVLNTYKEQLTPRNCTRQGTAGK